MRSDIAHMKQESSAADEALQEATSNEQGTFVL